MSHEGWWLQGRKIHFNIKKQGTKKRKVHFKSPLGFRCLRWVSTNMSTSAPSRCFGGSFMVVFFGALFNTFPMTTGSTQFLVEEQTTMSPTSASLPERNLILRSSQNLNISERRWGTVCPTRIREAISCTQPRHTSAEKKK